VIAQAARDHYGWGESVAPVWILRSVADHPVDSEHGDQVHLHPDASEPYGVRTAPATGRGDCGGIALVTTLLRHPAEMRFQLGSPITTGPLN